LDSSTIHEGHKPNRIIKGLIAAKLVNRKNINILIERYNIEILNMRKEIQEEYSSLISLLPSISLSSV